MTHFAGLSSILKRIRAPHNPFAFFQEPILGLRLAPRIRENVRIIRTANQVVAATVREQGIITPAEWFLIKKRRWQNVLQRLHGIFLWRRRLRAFGWMKKKQESDSWSDHREINMVMLVTSLAPDGFLMVRT